MNVYRSHSDDRWTTPVLIILIVLHLVLISAIFIVHDKRRENKTDVQPHLAQSFPVQPTPAPFAHRESRLKEQIKTKPQDIDAHKELVSVYKEQGRLAEAVEVLESALGKEPQRADIHLELGLLYYSNPASLDKAMAHFRKVLALDPAHPQKRVIEIWLKQGEKKSK